MLAPAKPELVRYLSENPGAVIEEAAKLHAVTPRDVVEALPAEEAAANVAYLRRLLARKDNAHTDSDKIPVAAIGRPI